MTQRTRRGGRPSDRDPALGPTQRQLRVGEELRHVLAQVLQRETLSDPELEGVSLTVTEVRVSPDLKNATAFVMPLGGGGSMEVIAALKRASGYIRGLVGRELTLKYTPRLGFALDTSFDQADRISELLRTGNVARDLSSSRTEEED